MGKIGDLFVRLGLKSDGFKKGMNDAKKETEGFGSKLSKIKGVAIAAWAAIGTAVVKFTKDVITSTNRTGDAWDSFIAQSKAGWNTFLQTVSSWNWDGWTGKIKEATRAAKNLQSVLDAEFEVSNSIKLQKAAMADELAELEILARNVSKPYEERAKAAKKYLEMVKPLYKQEEDLANRLLDVHQERWIAGTGLTDNEQTKADLTRFLVDYGKNKELSDNIAKYLELENERELGWGSILNNRGRANKKAVQIAEGKSNQHIQLQQWLKQYGQQNGYENFIGELANAYENMRGDADTKPLVDALIRAGEAKAAYDRETKRMQQALNQAENAENESEKQRLIDEVNKYTEMLGQAQMALEMGFGGENAELNESINKIIARIEEARKKLAELGVESKATIDSEVEPTVEEVKPKQPESVESIVGRYSLIPKALEDILQTAFDEIDNFDDSFADVKLEVPEIKTKALDKGLQDIQKNAEKYRAEMEKIAEYNKMLEDTIISSTANGMQALTDLIIGVEGADMKNVLAAFIAPFGDTLKQMGSMIMAEGIAMEAFKKSFTNPYAAIAAGATLIAVGAAVSSGLQKLTANPASGGTTASAGSASTSETQNYESTLTIEVTGKISGSDILISGQKTQNKWDR